MLYTEVNNITFSLERGEPKLPFLNFYYTYYQIILETFSTYLISRYDMDKIYASLDLWPPLHYLGNFSHSE